MKTAEDLATEIKHGLMWQQHEFKAETGKDYLTAVIAQIQLDAFKAGAEWAAETRDCLGVSTVRNKILTAAEQLTISDLCQSPTL